MLYEVTDWQSTASGLYYCDNVKDLAHNSGDWWLPARVLGISPAEFIKFLIENYKPDIIKYNAEKNFLYYAWSNYEKCHQWKLYINRVARKKNFQI